MNEETNRQTERWIVLWDAEQNDWFLWECRLHEPLETLDLFSSWSRSGHKWRVFKNSSHSSWQQGWAPRQHTLTVYSQLCYHRLNVPGPSALHSCCVLCRSRMSACFRYMQLLLYTYVNLDHVGQMPKKCRKSEAWPPAACPLSVIWVLRSAVCSMTILTHADLPSHS